MARQMHARAISMDYYVDSSEDEAILNMEDSDDDDDLSTVRGGNNPHPVAAFQLAFDESIADSAEQYRTGKPALELSSISAEERRKRLLMGEDYNDTYSAMWRETPASKYHPLKKIVAQITYGVHLLHVQMAVSNEEVVKILQRHIDQVDELIRRADEDLGMALADIEVRISHLKFALADRTIFDVMLEDKTYRDTIVRGNELIEDMIKRTEHLMNDVVADIVCGHDCISEMSVYMARIGSTWPMSTTDLGLYNTMVLNTEGWLECFDSLKLEGKSLNGCLMQLSALVEEMARRAENASKKARSGTSINAIPAVQQSLKLPQFPTRQSSTSRDTKPLSKAATPDAVTPSAATPSAAITPSARLSVYNPLQAPSDVLDLPVRRKTNISERRATAISEKRSSTATIASLFIGVDDDMPAMPDLPTSRKSFRKSFKRAKVPKAVEVNTRPRQISISSVKNNPKPRIDTAKQGQPETLSPKEYRAGPSDSKPAVPTISEPVSATPSKDPTSNPSGNSNSSSPTVTVKRSGSTASQSSSPGLTITTAATDRLAAPQPSPQSPQESVHSLESPSHTFLPPRPPFAESPVLGYPRSASPAPMPSPARSTPGHSPAPSIVVKRKPLPGSTPTSSVATPKLQHSPQPSAALESSGPFTDSSSASPIPPTEPLNLTSRSQASQKSVAPETVHLVSDSIDSSSSAVSHVKTHAERASTSSAASSVASPVTSEGAKSVEVLVPQVEPLLDEPLHQGLAPLTSKHLHLSKMNSISSAQQVLNRLSMSSTDSDESSIVPLSELAHPFRSNSPEPGKNVRSDSPAEGLGIDFPAMHKIAMSDQSGSKPVDEPSVSRKAPQPSAPVIEEESETEDVVRHTKPIMPLTQTKVTIIQTSKAVAPVPDPVNQMGALSPSTLTDDKLHSRTSTTSSRDSELSSILKNYAGLTSASSPKKPPVKLEVYQPKSLAKVEPPTKAQEPRTQPAPPKLEISTDCSGSPLPFLHSATQSTCHSASLSVSSNVNKALPAIPRDQAEPNLSPPQSPSAPSFFSSFSLGMSSDGGFDSLSPKGRANEPTNGSSLTRPANGSDPKTGGRTLSPLAPDPTNTTPSAFSSRNDDAHLRPQTSRSTKPSRNKLALFPSPSMTDLRSKNDAAMAGRLNQGDDADVGEDAESALPHVQALPRLVPRAKDGGRATGSNGVGTKLKKLIGFGRKNQKAIDVS